MRINTFRKRFAITPSFKLFGKLHKKKIGLFSSFVKDFHKINKDQDIIVEFESQIGLVFIDLIDYLEKLFDNKIILLFNYLYYNLKITSNLRFYILY